MKKTKNIREMDIVVDLANKLRQAQDKLIGSLLMLAHEGCISDGRAREIIGMDIYEWRVECLRVMRRCENLKSPGEYEPSPPTKP